MAWTFPSRVQPVRRLGWRAGLLWALPLVWNAAWADVQDIVVTPCQVLAKMTYAAKPGQAVPANTTIDAAGSTGTVFWGLSTSGGLACSGGPTVYTCAGMTVTVPLPDTPTPAKPGRPISGTAGPLGAQGEFVLTATDVADTRKTCDRSYLLHVTGDGGGWGDPHLTTVDGVKYDFQSAGEFTALRGDRFELQTRQAPVPTVTVPVANEYTGLSSCVAIYTAVAARIGSNRVTLQPAPGTESNASGLQLRVNGKLVTLPKEGLDLTSQGGGDPGATRPALEGRILAQEGGGIQIVDARGTQVVVLPQFWSAQRLWYLNVNVNLTSATQGTMGRIAPDSWLPALPDGSSLGPKPESATQRYQALYLKFADAWRVTKESSLFDYAPDTGTASFTLKEWPRDRPQSCGIEGQTSVQPAPAGVAEDACGGITNATMKANCIFDVGVTGERSFAKGYETLQRIEPPPAGWQAPLVAGMTSQPPWWQRWWWVLLLLLLLLLALGMFLRRKGSTP